MPDGEQEIKRGRKFEQVLAGAREIFLRDGFDGASVDDIARAAGVSKATLYSYFNDKRLLFMEVCRQECLRQASSAMAQVNDYKTIRDKVEFAARTLVSVILEPFNVAIFRVCVAEAERFPEIGEQFYNYGPGFGVARIAEFIEIAVKDGELICDDPHLAASQLQNLCRSEMFDRVLFLNKATFSQDQIDRVVNGAVEMFMARYAP